MSRSVQRKQYQVTTEKPSALPMPLAKIERDK